MTRVEARFASLLALLTFVSCSGTAGSAAQSEASPTPPAPAPEPVPGAEDDARVSTPDPVDDVNDMSRVWARLEDRRRTVAADTTVPPDQRVRAMIALGMWQEASVTLSALRPLRGDLLVVEGELMFAEHRYREAGRRMAAVLARQPNHREARLLRAELQVQAWDLAGATRTVNELLAENDRDEAAAVLLGRIWLLGKEYDRAADWAREIQGWNPNNADAFALEAEVLFWAQDPAGAEAPLTRALAIDPFNADARFSYGYAIWRRVDATQLDAMAAQWELALSVDPLHYRTHWHWGNGHTNLTYADYAMQSDSAVRDRLRAAEELIGQNRIREAVAETRLVELEFPESVLPALMRGSAFYMAYDLPRGPRLDSAQAAFVAILERKSHYGPAHNGLAAVIKQRQFEQLLGFDSLETNIETAWVRADSSFDVIFPDVAYYPGDRVAKMVRLQLGPSRAYLDMLARFDRQFAIPPLHRDLAEAMGQPRFRTTTTFDNRQWMDIRGVGSGATGIEYVERGAHWERNVLLHEYVHLVHGRVFTDAERRRVRALYYAAMENARTLDYYASNNESEFLAQAYPAFLSPVKAHALNHKAFNTRSDLHAKDPDTYGFVDTLIQHQEAYLAGDSTALASNWAHVFMRLSEQARGGGPSGGPVDSTAFGRAEALLDTALMWDAEYVPAHVSYVALLRESGRFEEAVERLELATRLDSSYAPAFAAYAELVGARVDAGLVDLTNGLDEQVVNYRRALALETDFAVRASLNATLRNLYLDYADYPDAIAVAEAYVKDAPTVSTYLRDRRDEASTFAHAVRSDAGYSTETLSFFEHLVSQKPQHFGLRSEYADALAGAGRFDEAIATLEEVQRILRAAGRPNTGYMIQTAEFQIAKGDSAAAREAVTPLGRRGAELAEGNNRYVRVMAALGDSVVVAAWLQGTATDSTIVPAPKADSDYTQGWILEMGGQHARAEPWYRSAIDRNPYHRGARVRLMAVLMAQGKRSEARRVESEAATLALPMGPDFTRQAAEVSQANRE